MNPNWEQGENRNNRTDDSGTINNNNINDGKDGKSVSSEESMETTTNRNQPISEHCGDNDSLDSGSNNSSSISDENSDEGSLSSSSSSSSSSRSYDESDEGSSVYSSPSSPSSSNSSLKATRKNARIVGESFRPDSNECNCDSARRFRTPKHEHDDCVGDENPDESCFTHKCDNCVIRTVGEWVRNIPIGLNLCPWARVSHRQGRIRYVVCDAVAPREATEVISSEARRLLGNDDDTTEESVAPWTTTLVICPRVRGWKNNFPAFDRYVAGLDRKRGPHRDSTHDECSHPASAGTDCPFRNAASVSDASSNAVDDNDDSEECIAECESFSRVTLVAFHPQFLRWRGLPETIREGSAIRCHVGVSGFAKSSETVPAMVVERSPKVFGQRRIKVRFDAPTRAGRCGTPLSFAEQYIPIDWVVLEEGCDDRDRDARGDARHDGNGGAAASARSPLSDNAMHRSPVPVVHILRNDDLASLSVRDVSRVKRINARTMSKLPLSIGSLS